MSLIILNDFIKSRSRAQHKMKIEKIINGQNMIYNLLKLQIIYFKY